MNSREGGRGLESQDWIRGYADDNDNDEDGNKNTSNNYDRRVRMHISQKFCTLPQLADIAFAYITCRILTASVGIVGITNSSKDIELNEAEQAFVKDLVFGLHSISCWEDRVLCSGRYFL